MQVNKTTPNNAKLINTGLKDKVTGEYIFQRINPDGKLYDSFISFTTNGTQKVISKPNVLRPSKPTLNHWTVNDMKSGYYDGMNWLYNPENLTKLGIVADTVYGYISPEPPLDGFQSIGGGIKKIEDFINEKH